jgi:glucose-6-phosphate 1-dehydrogenase
MDIIAGDRSLFLSYAEVEQAWRVVDPVLQAWARSRDDLHVYPAGSWGPTQADRLFEHDCQFWRNTLEACTCKRGVSTGKDGSG